VATGQAASRCRDSRPGRKPESLTLDLILLCSRRIDDGMTQRKFKTPWSVDEIPGGFRVIDANGIVLSYIYARDDMAARSGGNAWLTTEEAWKIATGIAKLPDLLAKTSLSARLTVSVFEAADPHDDSGPRNGDA
jgi:hypothetical protein